MEQVLSSSSTALTQEWYLHLTLGCSFFHSFISSRSLGDDEKGRKNRKKTTPRRRWNKSEGERKVRLKT